MSSKSNFNAGFTLVELLVVVAIIAILASMLLPAMGRAKQHAQIAQCLNNLHQIGIGLKAYGSDNGDTFPPGDSQQFNSSNPIYLNYGNALGGNDPLPSAQGYPKAIERPLTPYVSNCESWHCPADRGLQPAIKAASIYQFNGSSYRFNWDLQEYYISQNPPIADDPSYNLAGKKENWVPDPARFVMMHEAATYPWDTETGDVVGIAQWHYSVNPGRVYKPTESKAIPGRLVAPILFVDGHSQRCDFTKTFRANPQLPLEPGKDYRWYKRVN